jgi:hypothetical protein
MIGFCIFYIVGAFLLITISDRADGQSVTPTPSATATPGAVPVMVQHLATGMDRWPVNQIVIPLPNFTEAGNCLILGVQCNSAGSVSSVQDDQGDTFTAGPTAVNTAYGKRMAIFEAVNIKANARVVTVNFSGLAATKGFPHAVLSEWCNVGAIDGVSANLSSKAAGTMTPTSSGDLIYEWGADLQDTNSNGGNFNGSLITAGSGFTLLSADLQVGSCDQFLIQSGTSAINPTFTSSGSAIWGSVAVALRARVSGSVPASGMRIVHVQHTLISAANAQGRVGPSRMQFPSSGNLLVGLLNSGDVTIQSMTDSGNNQWATAVIKTLAISGTPTPSQIIFAANAKTSPNLINLVPVLSGATSTDTMLVLYDITGASTSPLDRTGVAGGSQETSGVLTTASVTPTTLNGVVFCVTSIWNQSTRSTVSSKYLSDVVYNPLDADADNQTSTLSMDNGYAHVYNVDLSAATFSWTYNIASQFVSNWSAAAASFKAGSTPPPTPTPTPLPVRGLHRT